MIATHLLKELIIYIAWKSLHEWWSIESNKTEISINIICRTAVTVHKLDDLHGFCQFFVEFLLNERFLIFLRPTVDIWTVRADHNCSFFHRSVYKYVLTVEHRCVSVALLYSEHFLDLFPASDKLLSGDIALSFEWQHRIEFVKPESSTHSINSPNLGEKKSFSIKTESIIGERQKPNCSSSAGMEASIADYGDQKYWVS